MAKPRVVIIGGGFGGAFTAKHLYRLNAAAFSVELINETNYFVFQPLLPEVASGTINAPDAVTPLRLMLPGIKVRMARVTRVDLDNRLVHFVQGTKRVPQQVSYDHLVIACGQKTNLDLVSGFAEHSLTMRNLADAHQLRNQVIQCLEHADITTDHELKRQLLTFVVAGGGFSGVETIGELSQMIHRTLRYYPNISAEEITAVLIQRGDRLLPELPESLGEYARRELARRRIDIRLNASVVDATSGCIKLDDDSRIRTSTLVTTVGNGPGDIIRSLGIALSRGKLPADPYLRISGQKNVWGVGDAVLIPLTRENDPSPAYAPPTAQFAVREARTVARNILALQGGRDLERFAYSPKGSLASLGYYRAVAEVFGLRLSGLLAWLMWRGLYIGMLPGFATRLRVALNWLFDYFLPRSIVQIRNEERSATRFIRVAKGDVLFRPGQLTDGLYTVVEGSLESRIPDTALGEDFVRILGVGEHWGERTISGDFETKGTLTALEDSRLLVLARDDFRNLRRSLPPLDDYFEHIPDKIYAHSLRRDRDP